MVIISIIADDSVSTIDNLEAASQRSDKAYNKFMKRVAYARDQVLRYDRNGEPLWVSAEKTLSSSDIPPCSICGGRRVFEFQVMPQLLNELGSISTEGFLDWGVLVVYTCEASCNGGPAYKEEYVWRQDFQGDVDNDD
jgi:pre-rRNA-processing protein TSR4